MDKLKDYYDIGIIDFETKNIQLKKDGSESVVKTSLSKLISQGGKKARFIYHVAISETKRNLIITCFQSEFINCKKVVKELKDDGYLFNPMIYKFTTDYYRSLLYNSVEKATALKKFILEKYPNADVSVGRVSSLWLKLNKWYVEIDNTEHFEDINHLQFKRYFLPRTEWSIEDSLPGPTFKLEDALTYKV